MRGLIAPLLRRRAVKRLVARDVWRGGAEACWDRFLTSLEDLEARAPRSGFWMGERLTVADIAIFAQLQSLRTPLTQWQSHAIGQKAALRGWLDRVDASTRGAAQTPAQRSEGRVWAAA